VNRDAYDEADEAPLPLDRQRAVVPVDVRLGGEVFPQEGMVPRRAHSAPPPAFSACEIVGYLALLSVFVAATLPSAVRKRVPHFFIGGGSEGHCGGRHDDAAGTRSIGSLDQNPCCSHGGAAFMCRCKCRYMNTDRFICYD
jgi:hypothetical protein